MSFCCLLDESLYGSFLLYDLRSAMPVLFLETKRRPYTWHMPWPWD